MNLAVIAQKAKELWRKTVLRKVLYMPAVKSAGSSNANPRFEYPEEKSFEVDADIKETTDENENRERGTSEKIFLSGTILVSEFAGYKPAVEDRLSYNEQKYKLLKISLDDTLPGFEHYFFEAENAN